MLFVFIQYNNSGLRFDFGIEILYEPERMQNSLKYMAEMLALIEVAEHSCGSLPARHRNANVTKC